MLYKEPAERNSILLIELGKVGYSYDSGQGDTYFTHFKSLITFQTMFEFTLGCVEPRIKSLGIKSNLYQRAKFFA